MKKLSNIALIVISFISTAGYAYEINDLKEKDKQYYADFGRFSRECKIPLFAGIFGKMLTSKSQETLCSELVSKMEKHERELSECRGVYQLLGDDDLLERRFWGD